MTRLISTAAKVTALVLASALHAQTVPTPSPSTYITNFAEESQPSVQMTYNSESQIGDLWPSCRSDGDHLYAADGDGVAFNGEPHPFSTLCARAVSRITGKLAAADRARHL